MTTNEIHTSEPTNLAQQIVGNKTPIAIAVAEYIRSLLHSSPDNVHVFGSVSGVKKQVWELTSNSSDTKLSQSPAANDDTFTQSWKTGTLN